MYVGRYVCLSLLFICVGTDAFTFVYVYVCAYVYMYVRMYMCMYICMYVCMSECLCVCVYAYMYVHVCMHVCFLSNTKRRCEWRDTHVRSNINFSPALCVTAPRIKFSASCPYQMGPALHISLKQNTLAPRGVPPRWPTG